MNKVNFEKQKIFTSKIKINKSDLTINFPKELVSFFDLKKDYLFWSVVGNTIQLTGSEPKATIPVLTEDSNTFLPNS